MKLQTGWGTCLDMFGFSIKLPANIEDTLRQVDGRLERFQDFGAIEKD